MKREMLLRLAEEHGVNTRKRVWFEVINDDRSQESRFMDLDRPLGEIRDELVAKGVLSPP